MGFSCLDCVKRFSQIVLIITNIVVAVSSVAVVKCSPAWRNCLLAHPIYF